MSYPEFTPDNCLHLSEKQIICPKWPVRIAGMQGLWRYLKPVGGMTEESPYSQHVEVVGPYFPTNPSRNGGRSRIIHVSQLKYPGKRYKPIDVIDVEASAASDNAKRSRRR